MRLTATDPPPGGVFPTAPNLLTPDVLEYHRVGVRGRVAYVELSEGEGFDRTPLYGVTFRRTNGRELWREDEGDPSRCFHDKAEAIAYIESFGSPLVGAPT